ncbi:MAG: hypothetical protein K8823_541 [Cenarchaeum symbiont of Oopsacas minuta]|nr:hypothetical protein [Cenarchaeum symbiont of Oopsacas minuta]
MVGYTVKIAQMHKRYNAQLKKAKSSKTVLAAFAAHKKAHIRLLKSHLKQEKIQVEKIRKQL